MNNCYLKDSRGGVLGPMSRQVAVDLIRAKPGVFLFLSIDALEWKVIGRHSPSIGAAESPSARSTREALEAKQLMLELARFRSLAPHELFGVPRDASLRDYRAGFVSRAKHANPGRAPHDVSAALVRAQMAVYQHLTEVLRSVERRFETTSSTRPGIATEWSLTRLQLEQSHERLEGSLRIDASTAHVFSIHRLMNLQNTSVFFPCLPTLQLGTKLRLVFRFVEAKRDVEALGAVALEAVNVDRHSHLRGFGVVLDGVKPEARQFMLSEVARLN